MKNFLKIWAAILSVVCVFGSILIGLGFLISYAPVWVTGIVFLLVSTALIAAALTSVDA